MKSISRRFNSRMTRDSGGVAAFAAETQYATGLTSHAIALRSFRRASRSVVPRPLNGSITNSPARVYVRMFSRANVSGNIAKYGQSACKRCLRTASSVIALHSCEPEGLVMIQEDFGGTGGIRFVKERYG